MHHVLRDQDELQLLDAFGSTDISFLQLERNLLLKILVLDFIGSEQLFLRLYIPSILK